MCYNGANFNFGLLLTSRFEGLEQDRVPSLYATIDIDKNKYYNKYSSTSGYALADNREQSFDCIGAGTHVRTSGRPAP